MSRAQIVVSPATGGVAVALDALMRERDGVWIAHGDGTADRAVVDAADKVRVPPDQPVVPASPPVAGSGGVRRVLRRIRERGVMAAVPSGGRASEIPERGVGGVSVGQRPLRRGDRRGAADGRYAGLHPGLSPRAGRRASARTAAGRAHGALLAHPVAVSRIGCASARGGARS